MIAHSISQPSALSRSIHDSKPPSLPNTPHPKHSSPQHVVSGAPSRAIGPRCRSKARSPPSSASGERAKRIGRNPVPTRDVRCSIDVRREKQGKHVCVYIYLVTGFAIGCKNVYIYISWIWKKSKLLRSTPRPSAALTLISLTFLYALSGQKMT